VQIDRWVDSFRLPIRMAVWLASLVVLMLLAFAAHSEEASLTWVHPVEYVDGGALPLEAIEATEVEYGRCGDTGLAAEPAPVSVRVDGPAAAAVVGLPDYGRWCFRARTIAGGVESDWTMVVLKDYPAPKPLPPDDLTAK
jgi:hypothetical protein